MRAFSTGKLVTLVVRPVHYEKSGLDYEVHSESHSPRCALSILFGLTCHLPRLLHSGTELLLVERVPRLVIIRPKRVSKSPIRHCATRVVGNSPFEARGRLFVVESMSPYQPTVKPGLSSWTDGAYGAVEGPEVIVII